MTNLVDRSDMYYISPERRKKLLGKEIDIVKKDGCCKEDSMLPLNTIINVPIDNVRKMGDGCGIYVLITKLGRTYVGSSQNIKKRVSQHRGNIEYMFDPIESVIICATVDLKSARDLEKTLIIDIFPDLNTARYDNAERKMKRVIKNLFIYSAN